MFGRCLDDVWAMFGQCLDDVWTMFGQCLGNVWTMFGRCLDDVWTMFGQCLGNVWDNLRIILPSFWDHFKIKIFHPDQNVQNFALIPNLTLDFVYIASLKIFWTIFVSSFFIFDSLNALVSLSMGAVARAARPVSSSPVLERVVSDCWN